ncbi:MAG: hypothetical protein IKW63_05755 [Elusimicrobiaceae bacterium]|nr:hypothetical protein [Elusimicrobiaceae bacterium]
MKKLFIFLVLFLLSAPAFAWVFTTEAVEWDRKSILLDKLVSGEPLGVCIHIEGRDCSSSSTCADIHSSTRAVFEAAYQNWFDTLRASILHSGRKDEFADILALIPIKLNFTYYNGPENNFVSCAYRSFGETYPRINLILQPFFKLVEYAPGGRIQGGNYNNAGTTGMAKPILSFHYNAKDFGLYGYPLKNGQKNTENRIISSNQSSYHTMQHELGHTLGLGDLYKEAVNNSYNSRLYTTNKIIPGPQTLAIMSREVGLTCDDMDGLINLLDHYFADSRLKNSVRRQKGWLSLCSDRNIAYAYGLPFRVTEEEKAQYKAFAAKAYGSGDPSQVLAPCAEKVRANYQQSTQGRNALEAQKAVADSLARVKQENLRKKEEAEKAANIAAYNQQALTCPVCGKKVLFDQEYNPYGYRIGETVYVIHVHSSCANKFSSKGTPTPTVIKTYGRARK